MTQPVSASPTTTVVVASNAVFRALADPTRRAILALLRDGPMTSGAIADRFPVAWATISRHLGILRGADLVLSTRDGNAITYELNTTVFQEFVDHVLGWLNTGGSNA
ncbi:MAG: autorepressor SdpR family transcription factor [Gemmatimonadaceae bacterium]